MPATDLPLLVEAARAAGAVAMRYAGETARSWDKPGGLGPVTEADIAVNDTLADALRPARPGYGWLSEETEDTPARLSARRVFIIDPIDGTRSFMDGSGAWAHSLAVAEGGVVTAAVVYLPRMDKLYAAAAGQGATKNGAPLRAATRSRLTGASVLSAKPSYAPQHWRGAAPDVIRVYRPSLAYRLSLVAEGRFDAMFTLRPTWEWDVAAGELILREAGAAVTTRAGAALRFNNATPQVDGVVAANPALHARIAGALAG